MADALFYSRIGWELIEAVAEGLVVILGCGVGGEASVGDKGHVRVEGGDPLVLQTGRQQAIAGEVRTAFARDVGVELDHLLDDFWTLHGQLGCQNGQIGLHRSPERRRQGHCRLRRISRRLHRY